MFGNVFGFGEQPKIFIFRLFLLTVDEYLRESKRTISHPYLQPQLICEEGLIQIGDGKDLFVLAIVIGSIENLDSVRPVPYKNIGQLFIFFVEIHDHIIVQ